MAMTKAGIVERVTTQCGFTRKEAIEYVETVFSIMKHTLESGEHGGFFWPVVTPCSVAAQRDGNSFLSRQGIDQ